MEQASEVKQLLYDVLKPTLGAGENDSKKRSLTSTSAGPRSSKRRRVEVGEEEKRQISDAYFESRLKDKRIQLANPDRPRPPPGGGHPVKALQAEQKLRKRKQRVKRDLKDIRDQKEKLRESSRRKRVRKEGQVDAKVGEDGRGSEGRNSSGKGKIKDVKIDNASKSMRKSGGDGHLFQGKESKKPLSRRRRKEMGLEELDPNISYSLLEPLHNLWCTYIQQLLSMVVLDQDGRLRPNPSFHLQSLVTMASGSVSTIQASLIKADFCGAELGVVRASNPSLVNLSGLVAKETERTFVIALKPEPGVSRPKKSSRRQVRVIPKHNTVFSVRVPIPTGVRDELTNTSLGEESEKGEESILFELHGNQMMHRLPSRATRKHKARPTVEF
ncbi:hypothetical protein IE53DRAFT_344349 [Violaceomyces palustris]|uniref:Uncharacterized protein n=1 Tax=Violaceomyces palustris TaxID=1673888 RepID=A0ACD0NWY8_9BASI|nr:hypothetical protein IE53DRAFT_344349 [Violaceomyces palustris]